MAGQGSDQHQVVGKVLFNVGQVRRDAIGAVFVKGAAGVSKELDTFQYVVDHDRFIDVQLEVALASCKRNCCVIAKHLYADHGQDFALRRVDLARHDG